MSPEEYENEMENLCNKEVPLEDLRHIMGEIENLHQNTMEQCELLEYKIDKITQWLEAFSRNVSIVLFFIIIAIFI